MPAGGRRARHTDWLPAMRELESCTTAFGKELETNDGRWLTRLNPADREAPRWVELEYFAMNLITFSEVDRELGSDARFVSDASQPTFQPLTFRQCSPYILSSSFEPTSEPKLVAPISG